MRSHVPKGLRFLCVVVAILLAACGGSGSDGDGGGGGAASAADQNPSPVTPAPPPPPATQPSAPSLAETTLALSGAAEEPDVPVVAAAKLALPAGAMVYDHRRNQLIVSAALSGNTFGLVALAPTDLSVLWTVATTSPATVLAISDDGSQLYAGLFHESAIQQFDLRTRSSVRKFAVAAPDSDPRHGAFDIAVRPGSPDTVAVSIGSAPLIPIFAQLALFVNGVRQPKHLVNDFRFQRASQIEFVDRFTLVGFDNETTGFQLSRISVADDGLTVGIMGQLSCCFDATLTSGNGRLLLSSGTLLDPTTLKVIKTLGRGTRFMMFHPASNSVVQFQDDWPAPGTAETVRLTIEEYDVDRGYLKRRFRVDEPLAGTNVHHGVRGEILAAVPTGPSSFAFLVYDIFSGATAVLAYDLAAIAPLAPREFAVRTAVANNVQVLSTPLATHSIAYDPAGNRLAASVPPSVGPQGNSLAVIRASDGRIERFVPLTSEPREVSVSQTGSIAYVSLPFEYSIQQVDLATGALGWKTRIDFPSPAESIGFMASSIAVKPDDPQTIVIAGCGGVFCSRNVMVLRNGQLAFHGPSPPFLDGTFPITSAVAFSGPTEVLGFDFVTTTPTLARFTLTASGLQGVSSSTGLLDIDSPVARPKVGHGFVYGRLNLVDLQANRRAGTFAPGSRDYFFFEQTLVLSPDFAVGHYQRLNSGAGEQAELYELLTRTAMPDNTFEFRGTSRIRVTDSRFSSGFKGVLVPMAAGRFAQGFTKGDSGTGVIYMITPR